MTLDTAQSAIWLADYYLLGLILLMVALAIIAALRQPARQLAVVKSSLVALVLLAALVAAPSWSPFHLLAERSPRPDQRAEALDPPAESEASLTATYAADGIILGDPPEPLRQSQDELGSNTIPTPPDVASQMTSGSIESASPVGQLSTLGEIIWPVGTLAAYLAGGVGVAGWLTLGMLAARRLRHRAAPAPASLVALLDDVAASTATRRHKSLPADLRISDRIDVAVALGVWRPSILLPRNWVTAKSAAELRTILAHEAAHVANRDLAWLALSRLLLILLWPQPLFWLLRRRMRLAQEALADAAAADVTGRRPYAEQLVAWAREMPARPAKRLTAAVGLWEGPSQLRHRVALLLDEQFSVLRQCSRRGRLAAVVLLASVAAGLSLFTLEPPSLAQPAAQPENGNVVSGRVTSEDGRPLVGAIVQWGRYDEPFARRQHATTDADGAYTLAIESLNGRNRLTAFAAGHAAQSAAFAPGRDVRDFSLATLPSEEHTIAGTVIDEQGRPIAGVRVEAFTPVVGIYSSFSMPTGRDYFPGPDRVAITDDQGRFQIADLPRGEVQLNLQSPHRHVNDANYPVQAGLRITMRGSGQPGVLQGRIVDAETGLPPLVTDDIRIVHRYSQETHTPVDDEGRFKLARGTLGGEYYLYIYAHGYAATEARLTAVPPDSAEVTDIRLSQSPSLRGRLVDAETGQPVAGAPLLYGVAPELRLWEWSNIERYADGYHSLKFVQRLRTGDAGEFWFAEPAEGPRGIIVLFVNGYQRLLLSPDERQIDPATGELVIRVKRESAFTGVVTKDGKPLSGVSVSAESKGINGVNHWYESVRTDAQGRYTFGRLWPGLYSVRGGPYTRGAPVGEAETAELNLGDDLGSIRIHGKAPPSLTITLRPDFHWEYRSFQTEADAAGQYEIRGLRPGRYRASLHFAYVTGYRTHPGDILLDVRHDGQQIDFVPGPGHFTSPQAIVDDPGEPPDDGRRVDIPIIVARHVLLHDEKRIEWDDLERLIAKLPDPKLAHPTFRFTRGVLDQRKEEFRVKIWNLRQRIAIHGHSWTSVDEADSARYDALRPAEPTSTESSAAEPPALAESPSPRELAGVVVDSNGQPLAGVTVDVWTWYPGHETSTDAAGRFRLAGFDREERLQVEFTKSGYSPAHFVDLAAGTPNLVVTLRNDTYLEGRVLDPSGKPVAGAQVRAARGPFYNPSVVISEVWTSTQTDAEGRYRLDLEPDTYDLQVRVPNVGLFRQPNTRIAANQRRAFDIPLQLGPLFRALVVDSQTGQPVEGIRLWNWRQSGVEGVSNAAGEIEIDNMLPGSFEFSVTGDGEPHGIGMAGPYGRWWSPDAIREHQRAEEPDGRFRRNFDSLDFQIQHLMEPVRIFVERGVTITGRVVDPEGQPVGGATVAPARTGTGNSLTGDTRYSVRTAGDGSFRIRLPASGDADINLVAHDGARSEWRRWANGIGDVMRTQPGQTIEGVELRLSTPAIIRGRVVDATGRPVADHRVRTHAADKLENRYYDPETRTDEQGQFEFRHVRPGPQLVQADPLPLAVNQGYRLRLGVENQPGSRLVTAEPDSPVEDIELSLTPERSFLPPGINGL